MSPKLPTLVEDAATELLTRPRAQRLLLVLVVLTLFSLAADPAAAGGECLQDPSGVEDECPFL